MKKEDKLRRNLVTLFTIFRSKPNILTKYIIDNDLLSTNMKKFIIDNDELTNKSKEIEENDDITIPYFTNFKEMQSFYNKFFETNVISEPINYPSSEDVSIENLTRELLEALSIEDYEKCTKIRDFCIKKGIDLNI